MAVDWGKMAKSVLQSDTWDESVAIWKLSNVLGWSESTVGAWNMSNVMGFYMSNYGAIKTQLMLGWERKINLREKYEWYMTAPTKVLMEGEIKIDMKEYNKVAPAHQAYALKHVFTMSTQQITAFENTLKANKDTKTIAGPSSTTCVGHTLNVTPMGDSTETIALGNKTITATAGTVGLLAPNAVTGIATLNGGGSTVVLNAAGATVTGAVINLG